MDMNTRVKCVLIKVTVPVGRNITIYVSGVRIQYLTELKLKAFHAILCSNLSPKLFQNLKHKIQPEKYLLGRELLLNAKYLRKQLVNVNLLRLT